MSSAADLARMHTAEHVLNQAMGRLLGCARAFGTHINAKKSKCDYRFPRPLTDAEARAVQDEVNAALGRGLAVSETLLPRDEAARRFDLSRLPETAGDPLRIVLVGDYDACPCIGEHVASTAEVGALRLTTHDWEDGVLRLRFKLSRPE